MTNRNRPLAAAIAVTLSLTVTAAATAQATGTAPDTTQAASPATQAPAAASAEERYSLVDVGGKGLPVEIEKEWRCREEVTAGTLVLRDGRWRLETSVRETCGDRMKMDRDDEDGMYRVEGTTIHFLDEDGSRNDEDWSLEQKIDLDDLDHGSVADGGTLTVRLADEKTVLRFRRQGV